MIGLYCGLPRLLGRLRKLLPNCIEIALDGTSLSPAGTAAPTTVVIVLPWLFEGKVRALVVALAAYHSSAAVVLVTTRDPDNARLARDLPIHELIWLCDIETELGAAVHRAGQRRRIEHFASQFEVAANIPLVLRRALALALRTSGSCMRVQDLAVMLGCDRRLLWRVWNRTYGPEARFRLEDVLGWVLLLRAASLKASGCGWSDIATELDVHQHTLGRLSQRLAGLTLRDLAEGGEAPLWALFESRVAQTLLGARATMWDGARHLAVVRGSLAHNS